MRKHWSARVSPNTAENGGAPSEHQAPTIWKIATLSGNESRPRPAFLLVRALIFCAPEGTRTPNLLIRRSPKPCRRRSPRPASCWSGLRGGRRSSPPSGTIRLRGSHPWLPDCQLSAFPRMGKQSCIPSVERWSGSGSRYGSPSPDWSFRLSSRAIGTRSSTPRSSDLARYRRPPSGTCRSAVSPRRRPCSDHE